ncbi:UDP-N-acetylmuramoyl-tripeptide--D-alanyl-D-alanine ligase [Porphyromonas pogonae]|uniref:UDP-N-acetylmuramoyl-tripeptide--D-alanyl-D- alanine ligase n=1 Tax=Porphyromonas pogonae TaxID=867595 RepID=UPI002E7A98C2|nr:UDP-N-acetylmuramoyl-tripeptide--D-alanyl-D-alanine ligase [Porphyromonas pogonae]
MSQIEDIYDIFCEHPTVVTDSRAIVPGCIFFALKGANFDGNLFASQALEQGAALAVVDDPSQARDHKYIVVEDALKTLQQLAAYHRQTMGIPIIGITGTNGKTTTKELVAEVLSTQYNILYTHGNLNNHIGVPLTLLRLTQEHQLAIVEMGASKPGDIKELVDIARPDYGLITNVGMAHLQGFGSLEGVKKTKGELYDFLRQNSGIAFLNEDDCTLKRMLEGIPHIAYGTKGNELVVGSMIEVKDNPFLSFSWHTAMEPHNEYVVKTGLVGGYNLPNALAAVVIGCYFNVSADNINRALETYAPSNNRSQLIRTEHNILIADAYNANPTSMTAAVDNFESLQTDKPKVLILGDMNELGTESSHAHTEMLKHIKEKGVWKEVCLCGPCFSKIGEHDGIKIFADVQELGDYLKSNPIEGSAILVKGSNGIHLERILPLC